MDDVNDVLRHFGILGMHWGRRKSSSSLSSEKKSHKPIFKKVEISEDAAKKNRLKKKRIDEMSNAELKSLNERLQLEKQYKDLTRSDVSRGQKFVMDVILGPAKQTASSYISKYMTKAVGQLINL